jgi:hypothetical protein
VETVEKAAEVENEATAATPTYPALVSVSCKSATEVPMSGGFDVELNDVYPIISRRTAAGTGWEVQFDNESGARSKVKVYVYCLKT